MSDKKKLLKSVNEYILVHLCTTKDDGLIKVACETNFLKGIVVSGKDFNQGEIVFFKKGEELPLSSDYNDIFVINLKNVVARLEES